MASQSEIINNIIGTIENSVSGFNDAMPGIQQKIMDRLTDMLKELDTDSTGRIKASVNNLKVLTSIKARIESVLLSPEYVKALDKYMGGYEKITKLQNSYFETLTKEFQPSKVLGEIKKQSIGTAIDALTEKGIGGNVTNKLFEVLNRNATSGAKYSDLLKQVNNLVLNNETGPGILERHTKGITTDALNQFSAQYTNAVTNDLGLEWFMYDGVIIDTSRDFCVALVKKKYFHRSELPDIIRGNFDEFKEIHGKINPKTDLPEGMYAGTTPENFNIYRGGHSCNHQMIPVSAAVVPQSVKDELARKQGKQVAKPVIKKDAPKSLENYPVQLKQEAFKGLKDAKVEVRPATGSYYDTKNKVVVINNKGRFDESDWYKENIVYHETGHATHFENGIITLEHVDPSFKKMFKELQKHIQGKERELHNTLRAEVYQDKDAELRESALAAFDVLGSLTSGTFGGGHTKTYYTSYNRKYMEMFAHGAEILFGENNRFKELMPEVYEALKKHMDEIYSNL